MFVEWILTPWPWIVAAIDIAAATAATVHAVLLKRDTRAVIGWVGLVWLAPFVIRGVRKAVSHNLRSVDVDRRRIIAAQIHSQGRESI